MSGFQYQGRRVADPRPVVRGDLGNDDKYADGLETAWERMNSAKSALRRVEFRASEAEKPKGSYLSGNQLGEFLSRDFTSDQSSSYKIMDGPNMSDSGESKVDKYGRTSYMKAKQDRKVARMEDRYQEKSDCRQRSPLREPNRESANKKHHERINFSDKPGISSQYTTYDVDSHINSRYHSGSTSDISRDITSSTAVRETELRFPNDFSVQSSKAQSSQPSRMHHVAVRVPSNTARSKLLASKNVPVRHVTSLTNSRSRDGAISDRDYNKTTNGVEQTGSTASLGSGDGTNTTYTVGDPSGQWKARKTLKDVSSKREGLNKVRELILQQRKGIQPSDTESKETKSKKLHQDDEVIAPRHYDIYTTDKVPSASRKVASGPPLPTYKGFSATETRYQLPEGRAISDAKQKKKVKRERIVAKAQEEKRLQADREFAAAHESRGPTKEQPSSPDKPRKIAKMVPEEKKPSKYQAHKDIITTSSWRAGQKIIMKELGPAKMPRATDSPPTRDKPPEPEEEDSFVELKPKPSQPAADSRKSTEAAKVNVLSKEAKDVLAALESDHSDDEEGTAGAKKPRLPPRQYIEKVDSSKPAQKVRHYDSSDVRLYMRKQKMERKRRENEEREARKRAEETKQKQLEELYRKQHKAARSKAAGRHDGLEFKSDSDKENKITGDMSSDSGTLTDRSGDVTDRQEEPPSLPPPRESTRARRPEPKPTPVISDHIEAANELIAKYVADQANIKADPVPVSGKLSAADVMKKFTSETGMTSDDVVSRFAAKTDSRRVKARPEVDAASSLPPRYNEMTSGRPLSASTGTNYRTRAERIKSLCSTATSLTTRLQLESQRLAKEMGPDRWAFPAYPDEEEEYIGRYQKLTGGKKTDSVFSSDLPGVGSLARTEEQRSKTDAATKIQAAYRGHSVRQTLGWRLPEYKSIQPLNKHVSDEEMSDMGDSTLTDDSFAERLVDKARLRPTKPVPKWTAPSGDPYSVMNIFSRKQKSGVSDKCKTDYYNDEPVSQVISHHSRSARTKSPTALSGADDYKSDFETGQSLSYRSERSARSVTYRDDFTDASAPRSKSYHTDKSRSEKVSEYKSRSSHKSDRRKKPDGGKYSGVDDRYSNDDDTLDGTLTPSIDSDGEEKKSLVTSQRSIQRSAAVDVESDVSGMSEAMEDERELKDPLFQNLPPPRASACTTGYGVPRMSPAALSSRMAMELNLLESMEESVRQLTDVERSRAVSMAQQETVSLAQILKARQQSHNRDMDELKLQVQKDKLSARNELEEARRHAAEAAQDAAKAIAQVRGDTSATIHQASQQLIETQLKATKATADIAKTLAEAKVSLAPRSESLSQDAVTAAATAAARAAVEASLGYRHIPGKPGAKDERGTQYSQRSAGPVTDASRTNGVTTETSRTDISQSYMSESFEDSYTQSPSDPSTKYLDLAEKKKTVKASDSEASEVGTASDLSPRGRADDSVETASVATESGLGPKHVSSGEPSSIATESTARPHSPGSKTESVAEEIASDLDRSEKDYSHDFDSSVAEELEQSIRDVVPDRSLRKRYESQSESIADEVPTTLPTVQSPTSARRLSFEDSFAKFTVDMVKQYMREEETRASHQNTLLKLREQALKEKVKAELAWIEQQKQRTRKKGEDDHYPILKKKQRGLMKKLQQEQAEIKRLQEANRAASKERQMLLRQSQEIARLRESTQEIKKKLKESPRDHDRHDSIGHGDSDSHWITDQSITDSESTSCVEVRQKIKKKGGEPPSAVSTATNEVHTEDEISLHTDDGDSYISKPGADDSELGRPPSPLDPEAFRNLKKMKLDEKFLTVREQKLRERRKKLLEWNDRLDQEEAELERMEKKACRSRKGRGDRPLEQAVGKDTLQLTPRTPRGADRSYATTIDESIATETSIAHEKPSESARSRTHKSITEEISTALSSRASTRRRTVSDSSIPEDISDTQDDSEIQTETRTRKTQDTSPDDTGVNTSANESYSNDTFEAETVQTTQARSVASVSATVPNTEPSQVTKDGGSEARPPKSAMKVPPAGRKGSESESDDSMTMPETASDQSDVEGRIRALNDALKVKKMEAEKLKREQKKRNKDKLREQELKLKKQIDAYDSYITQVRSEMSGEQEVDQKSPVQPQIKQPSESRHRRLEGKSRDSSLDDTQISVVTSPIAAGPNDTIREQQSPSPLRPSRQSSSESEQHKKTSTPVKTSEDKSEITEDIAEEVPSIGYSDTFTSDKNELKLKLDDDKDLTPKEVATPREEKSRAQDTARSMSEIAEEVTEGTPRSLTETREESGKFKLDLGKAPDSARSAYTDGTTSARSESKATTARSDYTEDYDSSTRSDRTETEDGTESRSYSRSYVTSRTESSAESRSKQDKSERSEAPSQEAQSEAEESIKESVPTEEDITEDFGGDDDEEEDLPMFNLKADEPSTPEIEVHLQPVPKEEDPLRDFEIGDRVVIGGVQPGTLRFKGYTKFATGVWGGVELDEAEGSNDGSKDGTVYFSCTPKHGIFAPPDKLSKEPAVGAGTDAEGDSDVTVTEDGKLPSKSLQEEIAALDKDEGDDEHSKADSAAPVTSELEEIIKSSSQAVEDFIRDGAASPADTIETEEGTPRDLHKDKEELVDRITDSLTSVVVKDSLETLGNIGAKNESENEESSKAPEKKNKPVKDEKVSAATEQAMNNMLNEAISQMITIRQNKQAKIDTQEIEAEEKEKSLELEIDEKEDKIKKDTIEKEKPQSKFDLGDTASLLAGNQKPKETKKDSESSIDDLYSEIENLTGDDFDVDGWMDDDFGLGIKKPPPPYTDKSDKGAFGRNELQIDLQKLSEDLYFAVPHKEEEVLPLVDEVIDVFWDMRRCGESWDSVKMPESLFKSEDKSLDMEGKSKHSFKCLVFDLTSEILREMYKEEEEVECPAWQKPPSQKRKFHKSKTPPTTVTDLKPIVQDCVLEVMRLKSKAETQKKGKKWGGGRKKKDHVDQILVSELREEEPDWINYDLDELSVKMQLADTLFESLLGETTKLFSDITQKKGRKAP